MDSWIPIVTSVTSTISTGAIALVTFYFTNKWNEKRFDKQIQHEREK
jgi:hypothetical protein